MKRVILSILFLAIICGIGAFLYREAHLKKPRHQLTLYGNVDVRQVDIGFRVAGKVAELYFEEGDLVPQSTLLAVLDKTPYDSQILKAKATIHSIQPELKNAEILLGRRERAVKIGGVTQEEVDTTVASRDQLLANLRMAEADLAIALDNMSFTEAYAPNEGIILSRIREPGSIVNPADPVYTLSLTSPIWVRAYVNEPDLGLIYYGMKGEVYTDSGQTYAGTVGFISPIAEFTPKTVETAQLRTDLVYRLRIYVDNPDRFLKQGMPVTVKLQLDQNEREKSG